MWVCFTVGFIVAMWCIVNSVVVYAYLHFTLSFGSFVFVVVFMVIVVWLYFFCVALGFEVCCVML